jgi:hypothetical protein
LFFIHRVNIDVGLNQSLRFIREDFRLEALQHEDEACIGVAAFVATVIPFDIKDGFVPTVDASAMELGLGRLDAFGVANFVALKLSVFETGGEFGATGKFEVELAFADTFFLDGGMRITSAYQVFINVEW